MNSSSSIPRTNIRPVPTRKASGLRVAVNVPLARVEEEVRALRRELDAITEGGGCFEAWKERVDALDEYLARRRGR
jgi:hypothetical protein